MNEFDQRDGLLSDNPDTASRDDVIEEIAAFKALDNFLHSDWLVDFIDREYRMYRRVNRLSVAYLPF